MNNVLVIGGSGFIGSHLLPLLSQNSNNLINMDLVMNPGLKNFPLVKHDIRNPISRFSETNPDVVVILAAVHRTPGHAPNEYYDTNVGGVINIIKWCLENKITKIIFLSSIAVYGSNDAEMYEKSVPSPHSDYGRSKLLAEEILQIWQKVDPNHKLTIIRPGVIFGKGEFGNFSRMAKSLRQGWFVLPARVSVIKASGYVKDLCRCIAFALSKMEGSQTYNFAFPNKYSVREICAQMQSIGAYRKPLSLPLDHLSRLMIMIPILSSLGSRIRKRYSPTLVSTSLLESQGFDWQFDLRSALLDWYKDSEFHV